jgi:hypothetical protein
MSKVKDRVRKKVAKSTTAKEKVHVQEHCSDRNNNVTFMYPVASPGPSRGRSNKRAIEV